MKTKEEIETQSRADDIWKRMTEIMDSKGGMTAEAAQRYDALEKELNALHQQRVSTPLAIGTSAGGDRTKSDPTLLKPEQRVADWVKERGDLGTPGISADDESELSFARALRGMVTGNWRGAELERRVLSEGTNSAGGYTVPTILSSQIIDLIRNETAVFKAGAITVPMTSEKHHIPRVAGDPASEWRAENAAIAEGDLTFERVEFQARSLNVFVKSSWELVEDSAVEIEHEIRKAFAREFAIKLDKTALYGTGTPPEPRGVKNASGINKKSMAASNTLVTEGTGNGATPTNFDTLVDAVGFLSDLNRTATGMILAPRTERTIAKKFIDTTNQPLSTPDALKGVTRHSTNQVPTNLTLGTSGDCTDLFAADWSDLLIGMRTELIIRPLFERFATDGQVAFVGHLRADVQLRHPESFTLITGIRP